MGQPVVVVEKPSRRPGIVRFEANRSLSGMGHDSFTAGDASGVFARANTPAAELARRLFATGRVAGVHVYQNMVTVDLNKGFDSEGLDEIVRDLYQYWKPGMTPPAFEDLVAEEAPAAATGDAPAAGGAAIDSRVPAHLIERSRAARAKWEANRG
jgi:hypothetical protein